eukprot:TRINITY_DN16388_c0_g1_i2.p1 TRINITY_DN16388_c0_g1~~TRINITY_DN16388_c0_g1_i2.p1  ORF type:complete len:290 (-),score=63.03 TRINITY_DN16388_c0_g1_i2:376-1245(-)
MGAFLERPITTKEVSESQGNDLHAVCCHMQGWRVSMEDAAVHTHQVGSVPVSLFGVFDGHGGSFAAQYTENKLPDKIVSTPMWTDTADMPPETLAAALRRAALDVDTDLRGMPAVHSGEDRSGTTAVFGLVTPGHIIIANIGDSRSVLATGGKTVPMSFDHKPTNAGEQKRIEDAGGSVTLGRVNGDLAVSRALGDFSYKRCGHLDACLQQVSPEAEIKIVERSPKDEFLILACDGIWDVMSNDECTAYFREALQQFTPAEACANLLDECLNKQSKDNMTVVLVLLNSQ